MLKLKKIGLVILLIFLSYILAPVRTSFAPVDILVESIDRKVDVSEDYFKLIPLIDDQRSEITYKILDHSYASRILDFPVKKLCFFENNLNKYTLKVNGTILENEGSCFNLEAYRKVVDNSFIELKSSLGFLLRLFLSIVSISFIFFAIKRKNLKTSIFFLTLLVYQSLIAYLNQPALFDVDLYTTLSDLKLHRFNDWYSSAFFLFSMAAFSITESLFFILSIHIIFYAFLFALIFQTLEVHLKKNKIYYQLFLILVFVWPSVGLMNLYLTRDWGFTFFTQISFSFLAIKTLFSNKKTSVFENFLIIGSFVILVLIRREFILQGLVFILIAYKGVFSISKTKVFFFSIFILSLLGFIGNRLLVKSDSACMKILTSFANPVTAMLMSTQRNLSPQDLAFIGKAYDTDKLVSRYNNYHPLSVHGGAIQSLCFEKDENKDIFKRVLTITYKNLWIFVKHRWQFINHFYSGKKYTHRYPQDFTGCKSAFCHDQFNRHGMRNIGVDFKRAQAFSETRGNFYRSSFGYGFFVFWPFLAILCLVSICFKVTPVSSALAFLFLARQPIIFCLLPAAYFKYITSEYLGAFFVLMCFCYEFSERKKSAA